MNKIEHFLQSKYYVALVVILSMVAFIARDSYQYINTYIMVSFLVMLALILSLMKNTLYTLPLAFGLLYTYNLQNPNLDTISSFNIIYVIVIFVLGGLIIHLIRFKPKFEKGVLTLPYIIFAILYLIPMIYRPFTWTLFQLSFIGTIYLLVYQFYLSTSKPLKDFSIYVLFGFSLLLLFEMSYQIGLGFFTNNIDLPIRERISLGMRASWFNGDFGWANINDAAIHITLLLGAQFYFVIRYKTRILFWVFPLLTGFAILLSASRGGYLSMFLSFIIYLTLVLKNINKAGLIRLFIVILIVGISSYFLLPIFEEAFDIAIQGGFDDLDSFTSSRITLYNHALDIFRQYPLFGAGWEAMTDIGNPNRIQVFHSTIFHALAVMGSFGLLGLIYYFYVSFKFLLTKKTLLKTLMFVGILVSQIHGLIDNTMFMLIYTLVTILIFVSLEKMDKASV